MAKKLQRVFRDRPLTPEEIAADKELRRQIEIEFPPKRQTSDMATHSFSELLRRSIRASRRSIDEIASDAGIPSVAVERFLTGERDIHMRTADRLARALGLEVTAE